MPASADYSRLHKNETAAAKNRRGVDTTKLERSASKIEWTSSADAIFRQVLDGIVDTALIDYPGDGKTRQTDHIERAEKWSFAKTCAKVLKDMKDEETPGVGHYDIPHPSRGSSHRIAPLPKRGRSQKKNNDKADPVGPGSYDVSHKAISKRSPSPVKMHQPTVSRKKKEGPTPGPGEYSSNPKPVKKVKPGAVMGTSARIPNSRSASPGPAAYETKKPVLTYSEREGGKWRCPEKTVSRKQNNEQEIPGPGAYNTTGKKNKKAIPHPFGSAGTGRLTRSINDNNIPGPGHYEDNVPVVIPKPSSATFGTTPKDVSKTVSKSSAPGPGAYDTTRKDHIKGSYTVAPPTQLAREGPRSSSPGPGAYDPELHKALDKSTGVIMGTTARSISMIRSKDQIMTPGPGAYSATVTKSVPNIVIGSATLLRSKSPEITTNPGPGTYDSSGLVDKKLKQTIGTSKRIDQFTKPKSEQNPGPGAYLQEQVSVNDSRNISFSKADTKRLHHDKTLTPGPGAYSTECDSEKPGSSLALWKVGGTQSRGLQISDCDLIQNIPGPGSYDAVVNRSENNTAGAAFHYKASTDRLSIKECSVPGPGSYLQAESTSAKGATIGTEPRHSAIGQNDGPGPAEYDIRNGQIGISATNQQLYHSDRTISYYDSKNSIPGPGYYDIHLKENHGVVIGTAPRVNNEFDRPGDTPGPGQYQQATIKSEVGYQFSNQTSSQRDINRNNDQPGPGVYEDQISKPTSAAVFGTEQRGMQSQNSSVPGPGSYAPHDQKLIDANAKISISLGTRTTTDMDRSQMMTLDVPGPGHYNIPGVITESTAGTKIGTELRMISTADDPSEKPGPGSYEVRLSPGKSVSIFGKQSITTDNDVPGPGSYNQQVINDTRGVVVGTEPARISQTAPTDNPGPGAYEQHYGIHDIKGGLITDRIQRPSHPNSDIPGPGAYDTTYGLIDKTTTVIGTASRGVLSSVTTNTPGPGHYDIYQPDSGPVISFGDASNKLETQPSDIPGPGHYNITTERKTHSASVGTAVRFEEVKNDTPGPGYYQLMSVNDGPEYSMAGNVNLGGIHEDNSAAPGPGAYNVLPNWDGPTTSIGTAIRSDGNTNTDYDIPGPGTYMAKPLSSGPVVGITSSDRMTTTDEVIQTASFTPGPGHYDIQNPQHNNNTIIGTEHRHIPIGSTDTNPGPGHYDEPKQKPKQAWSMGGVVHKHDTNINPGPGHYDIHDGSNTRIETAIGTAERVAQINNIPISETESIPGPGAYDIISKTHVKGGVIGAVIDYKKDTFDNPGPGAYDNEVVSYKDNDKRGVVIGTEPTAHQTIITSPVPGPGSYEPRVLDKGPTALVTTEQRVVFKDSSQNHQPGPGHYEHTQTRDAPEVTIGTESRNLIDLCVSPTPGPGAYEVPIEVQADDRGWTFPTNSNQSFKKQSEDAALPGPGSYVDHPTKPRPVTIGLRRVTSDELYSITHKGPGPGEYYIPMQSEAPKITIAPKLLIPETVSDAPGPGTYYTNRPSDAPSYSITSKTHLPDNNLNPGPGDYTTAALSGGPKHSFGRKHASLQDTDAPGPGQYRISSEQKSGMGGVTIPKEVRMQTDDDKAAIPGPGAYHNQDNGNSGPAYSVTHKPRDYTNQLNDVPGPGQYHMPVATGGDAPAMSMSFRMSERESDPTPAPGRYHIERSNTAPAASIIGKPHSQPTSDIPGPGTYHMPEDATKRVSNIVIGSAKKLDSKVKSDSPGPGQYHSVPKPGEGSGPKVSISNSKTVTPVAATPGPGTYSSRPIDSTTRGVSMAGKPKPPKPSDIPGPGTYSSVPSVRKTTVGGTLGKPPKPKKVEPQPEGFFNVPAPHTPSFTIGRKVNEKKSQPAPGPGSYSPVVRDTKRDKMSGGFSKSIAPRPSAAADRETPGPGAYGSK